MSAKATRRQPTDATLYATATRVVAAVMEGFMGEQAEGVELVKLVGKGQKLLGAWEREPLTRRVYEVLGGRFE